MNKILLILVTVLISSCNDKNQLRSQENININYYKYLSEVNLPD